MQYEDKKAARKPWVTPEMIQTINERRKWKTIHAEEGRKKYKSINNRLRRETDKARETWWKERCDEVERLDKQGRSDLMYRKVKELTKKKKRRPVTVINDNAGNKLTDSKQVQSR